MYLEFKIEDEALLAKLRNVQALNKDHSITRKIANILMQDAEDAFDDERSPEGEKWAELSSNYRRQRYKKGYDGKLLQVTGDLINSLNIDYGEDFALVGVSELYGKYHQLGTKHMNARPFLGLSNEGIEEIHFVLDKALKKAIEP